MRGHNDEDSKGPRPIFSRSPDGRLRAGGSHIAPGHLVIRPDKAESQSPVNNKMHQKPPMLHKAGEVAAAEHLDVGDIWSEQERIRLKENWEEEQRKAERRQRRKTLLRTKLTGIPAAPDRPHDVVATTADVSGVAITPHTDPKEITLNISMPSVPKITLPKVRIPALPRISRQRVLLFGSIATVLVAGTVGYNVYQDHRHEQTAAAAPDKGVTIQHLDPAKQTGKPDYPTVLPEGKTIKDFGGWVRISPPEKNPVYAYADEINGVLVNVSEQPLPETFKKDVSTAMDDLATQYNANDQVKVGSITAYIGTSAKGPQSVLFAKGDLLVLIKSASKIPEDRWATYIRSLQ